MGSMADIWPSILVQQRTYRAVGPRHVHGTISRFKSLEIHSLGHSYNGYRVE